MWWIEKQYSRGIHTFCIYLLHFVGYVLKQNWFCIQNVIWMPVNTRRQMNTSHLGIQFLCMCVWTFLFEISEWAFSSLLKIWTLIFQGGVLICYKSGICVILTVAVLYLLPLHCPVSSVVWENSWSSVWYCCFEFRRNPNQMNVFGNSPVFLG